MPQNVSVDRLIVIGGSAGSLDALSALLPALPRAARAAVLVVVHTSAQGGAYLPKVISRMCELPVAHAVNGESIRAGRLYVAPATFHLKVIDGKLELNLGPREHHTRPAVDVLFRSAARAFGPRVIGIVLSGYGGDGSAGVIAIRARGGRVLIQSPQDAVAPSMPQRAIETAGADDILSAAEIGVRLATLVSASQPPSEREPVMLRDDEQKQARIQDDIRAQEQGQRDGETSVVSCPDCGGILWQLDDDRLVTFQCHIGHRYTPDTLVIQKTEQLEAALVSGLRLLKEKAILLRQAAQRARERGEPGAADRLAEQAGVDDDYAALIQRALLEAEPSSLSSISLDDEINTKRG